MRRTLTAFSLSGLIALGGCGTLNQGMESVHQPVVARTDYVYDMPAPADRLDPREDQLLSGWLTSLRLGYGDHVAVDSQGLGEGPRGAVALVVARYGLLVDETAPVTQGDVPPGDVRVVVSRTRASVPNCPDWSRSSLATFSGSSISNYGCATNSNLAAMVADPRDLISGRQGRTTIDAALGNKAIATYRAAPNTGASGLKVESTKGK